MKSCPYCDEEIQDKAIKCKHCGEWLNKLGNTDLRKDAIIESEISPQNSAGERVVLNNDFLLKFHEIYFEKMLKRVKAFNEEDNLHASVSILDSKILKMEYEVSIKKCFNYLILSCKKSLGGKGTDYVRDMEKKFLASDSPTFLGVLSELRVAADDVLQNVPDSGLERVLNRVSAGAAIGSIIPGAGTLFGAVVATAGGWVAGNLIDKKEQRILDRWNALHAEAIENYQALWGELLSLLEDISEHTPIVFDFDVEALEQHCNERSNQTTEQGVGTTVKLQKIGLKREKGFLYFIDSCGDISRAKKASGGKKGGKAEVFIKVGLQREDGFLYFIDKDGDISRARER